MKYEHGDPMLSLISKVDAGSDITASQEVAAELLIELEDAAKVDAVLGLDEGTTKKWSGLEPFQDRVKRLTHVTTHTGTPKIDYSKALDPRHTEAVRLKVLDHLTPVEIADKLEVSTRAVRDWFKRPEVTRYMEQLVKEKEQEEREARGAQESKIKEILRGGQAEAAQQLVENARKGDMKAIA